MRVLNEFQAYEHHLQYLTALKFEEIIEALVLMISSIFSINCSCFVIWKELHTKFPPSVLLIKLNTGLDFSKKQCVILNLILLLNRDYFI